MVACAIVRSSDAGTEYLMRVRTPIYAFNGGEISRRMEGRADLDGIYDRAVAEMFNFVAAVEGPAMKRPGFEFIRPAHSTSGWLSRFIFNQTQAYVLEWRDGAVRFYTNGGRIEDAAGNPYEVAVPYTAAEASRLSIKQSYDRLYIAHPDHPPAALSRLDAETFSYAPLTLKNGPYQDWNTDDAQTLTWSGDFSVGGTATVTLNSPAVTFTDDYIGSSIIFEVVSFADIQAWEPQVRTDTLNIGDKRRSDGKVYQCVAKFGTPGNEYTGTIEPTHTKGSEWDGSGQVIAGTDNDVAGVQWLYLYDRYGAGQIVSVESANSVTIKVTRALPDLAEATPHWALAEFSNAAGWPQLVDVWAQRLIFWKDLDLAGSVVGDYLNFAPLDDDGVFAPDMAFRQRLDVADPPLWTHADKAYLLAGSASGELVVGQINSAAGISATNLRADPQSSYGSSQAWPLPIGTGLLFVQRGGRKIREAEFSYTQERFVGANINIYARHITRSGVKWMAFQQEPEEMLWCGRGDGTLAAHPHSPDQQIKGFSRVELGAGTVICGVTIPSDDGERDDLWILADLDGQRGVLKMADWWDEDAGLEMADAFFVDWGVSYDGVPKQDFTTGLSHLEGRNVRVLYDGAVIDTLTVTDGAISLPVAASKVKIGIGYQARLTLLQPEVRGAPTAQGMKKRLMRMWARLIDTASMLVQNIHGDKDRMFNRADVEAMDAPPPLLNGATDNVSVGDGSDFEVVAKIVNDDPLPCIVSMLVPTYELEESVTP